MGNAAIVTGTLRGLLLFDIAETIDLAQLHTILGTSPRREPAFRHPSPEYVRFERPPVTKHLGTRRLDSGETVEARLRYFDYGIVSLELHQRFRGTWTDLIASANRWISAPQLETVARALLRESLTRTQQVLTKPYEKWISEDYYMVQIDPVSDEQGATMSAENLIRERGPELAAIVRGEDRKLSPTEQHDVLQGSLSYYPSDLLVIGWVGAVVYDGPEAAEPTMDLLEYANTQLLEYRYYDDVLTGVLERVYKVLEGKRSMWARWKMAREAESLNTIRLDYQELAERTDNAIKFLSDMFYARAYRLAAARIGVTDYRALVTLKLGTARDLYDSMVNEFHQGRAFFLEVMVIIILVVEIVLALVGKH